MTTKRQPFNTLTKKTILIDLNGERVTCAFPGCKCNATHIHHEQYVSNGGTNEVHNLTAMCTKHHIQLHSTRGDFREWGALGGKKTHEKINVNALKNLPQFRGEQGEIRLQAYIAKRMGV